MPGERACLAGERACLAGERACLAGERACLAGERACLAEVRECLPGEGAGLLLLDPCDDAAGLFRVLSSSSSLYLWCSLSAAYMHEHTRIRW